MNKSDLLLFLHDLSLKMNKDLILDCLNVYDKYNTQELTTEDLKEYIKERGLNNG